MTIPSLNELSSAAGGIFVPDELPTELNMLLRDASCVERFARHIKMKRLKMIRRKQSDGVDGYWVDAMAVKPKDAPAFDTFELEAEKVAVIIPLEDQLLEDADTDIAQVVRTDVVGAFQELLDRTYMGYEISTPFAQSLSGSTPGAHAIAMGTSPDDLVGDLSLAVSAVEQHGWDVTGMIAHPSVKHLLRNLRDLLNQPIFAENLKDSISRYAIWGKPICFSRQVQQTGSPLASEILMAYFDYVMIGDRMELAVSKSTEATLTQGTDPNINLFEQDMTAFRFVTRKAFVIKDVDVLAKVTDVA